MPEDHATEEGPPLKMIKLTAHHLGFDDDVFPPESKPKNVFATKSKPKTNERPPKPKSKIISARSSTANVKEKNISEENEENVIVVPQKKKKRPKHLRKKGKWGELVKRGKDLAKQLQDEEKRFLTGGRRNSRRSGKKEKDTEEEKEEEEEEDIDEEEDEEKKKEEHGKKRKRESSLGKVMPEPCNQCGEIFETPAALEIHRVQEYC